MALPRIDAGTERRVLALLKRYSTLSIATIRPDGYPQATTVTYSNDGLRLYFACDRAAQKVRNIRRSGKVSLTIDRAVRDWSRIKGISMAADARILRSRAACQHAFDLLQTKFPQWRELALEEVETLAFVEVVPRVISVLDYSKGFGHSDLVRV